MTARIIQITDSHLFADPRATLKGICTRERFTTVLSAMRDEIPRADRLIITGDLTHDENPATYAAIREALSPWLPKLRILPGNHDDRAIMRQQFPDIIQDAGERVVFSDTVGKWQLIGLDSQLTGSPRGELSQPQLTWLEEQLRATPDQPAALFLHHPPVRVGSPWLEQMGLEDSTGLWDVVRQFPQVKVICAGHVHQELAVLRDSVLVLTTPSTGVQFRPETETLMVDDALPGYRILELEENGGVRTRVIRVGSAARE